MADQQPPLSAQDHEPIRRATTASMQNLLAQYFEAQAEDVVPANDPAPLEPVRHALSVTDETPKLRPEDAIAASFARLEAALHTEPPVVPEVEPVQTEWPVSAQALIESLMMENERLREQLHQRSLELQSAQDQADSDVLTPTLNRRAFLQEVHRAMADCKRYGEEACLIYLDMDSFKAINDAYGHGAGDAALIYVAETLKTSVREGDAVARIGGDEFAILLRRADLKSSRVKAMKLEAELMMGTFAYNGLYLKTGGSFGVRAYAGQTTAEAWLSEADAAMFLVKKSAR
ncbi:GGDEF domain-containing protein [Asticcacaulis sp. AC460]|uniref:GGDEF domain-containing protein n=1 Tax=Asticcacaulis sp. AC460 TaxID=1282360 RepID=UPI001F34C9F6|nr:GGDEF domain-containing protein [Asticcacaulis sp. AC460]